MVTIIFAKGIENSILVSGETRNSIGLVGFVEPVDVFLVETDEHDI